MERLLTLDNMDCAMCKVYSYLLKYGVNCHFDIVLLCFNGPWLPRIYACVGCCCGWKFTLQQWRWKFAWSLCGGRQERLDPSRKASVLNGCNGIFLKLPLLHSQPRILLSSVLHLWGVFCIGSSLNKNRSCGQITTTTAWSGFILWIAIVDNFSDLRIDSSNWQRRNGCWQRTIQTR